jgi:hypothetical protein
MTHSANTIRIFARDPAFNGGREFHVCTLEAGYVKNELMILQQNTPGWSWSLEKSPSINNHAISQIKSPHYQASNKGHRKGRGRPSNAVRLRTPEQTVTEVSREAPVEAHRLSDPEPFIAEGDSSDQLSDLGNES